MLYAGKLQLFCGEVKFAFDIWEQRMYAWSYTMLSTSDFPKQKIVQQVLDNICKSLQEDSNTHLFGIQRQKANNFKPE